MPSPADLAIPHVWRVTDLAREERVVPSGHALLDAQLPGGGWPVGSLVEVLQHRPERTSGSCCCRRWRTGVQTQGRPHRAGRRAVASRSAPALAAQGLPAERLLWIRVQAQAARLWAAEQALRCADVAAVLAWLPQCAVRRPAPPAPGGTAARQAAVRVPPAQVRAQASPGAAAPAGRGRRRAAGASPQAPRPAAANTPLQLPAQPARLPALLASRRRASAARARARRTKGDRMFWIALSPPLEQDRQRLAAGGRLRFTPRVAQVEEALLLEASGSLRLFGGRKALLRRCCSPVATTWAPCTGPSGRPRWWRWRCCGCKLRGIAARQATCLTTLPLDAAHARPCRTLAMLERIGCRTWGAAARACRAPASRGASARRCCDALDAACGRAAGELSVAQCCPRRST